MLGWAVVTRWLKLRPSVWREQFDQDSEWGLLADSAFAPVYWSVVLVGYLTILLFWPVAVIRQRRNGRSEWF